MVSLYMIYVWLMYDLRMIMFYVRPSLNAGGSLVGLTAPNSDTLW